MTFQTISAIVFASIMALLALLSWGIVLSGRFKSQFMLPCLKKDCYKLARLLFLIQSFLLLFAAGLVWMRITQLNQNHEDNVIDNLIYGLSSLLLIRAIGDFKFFGLFRTEEAGDFTRIDTKIATPMAFILFVLSLLLVI